MQNITVGARRIKRNGGVLFLPSLYRPEMEANRSSEHWLTAKAILKIHLPPIIYPSKNGNMDRKWAGLESFKYSAVPGTGAWVI